MSPMIWIIDEEWPDYDVETSILRKVFPGCDIRFSGNDYDEDLKAFGYEADAIISQIYVNISKEAIDALKKCRVISVLGGGYDRVDVYAARKKGIEVTFVPGYCVEDVSDYVIASIFHANKRITDYGDAIASGIWGAQAVKRTVHRLKGSTLFIIGLGRIGSAVARKAKSIGLEVIAYDPYVKDIHFKSLDVKRVSWEEGFKRADFISVNAKLTPETEGMIGQREFLLMKPTAYVINTARGAIIDEDALIDAVKSNLIAGAYLDVVRKEPPDLNDEILHCPGILVTPHISYLSEESFMELRTRATNNVVKVLKGKTVEDRVDI